MRPPQWSASGNPTELTDSARSRPSRESACEQRVWTSQLDFEQPEKHVRLPNCVEHATRPTTRNRPRRWLNVV